MKNIFRILSLTILGLVLLGCENEYEPAYEITPNGAFLRFDEPLLPVIDFTAIESSSFTNVLEDPSGSVASFEMFVSLSKPDSTYDTVSLAVITSFPHNLSISADDVVAAYAAGLDNSTLDLAGFDAGDQLNIISTATRNDGAEFTSADFTGDLTNPGMRQAFDFTVFFSCPFSVDDAVSNTYSLVFDGFPAAIPGEDVTNIEAIAGPGENQVTFVNLFRHPGMYDIIVTVDPETGVATVDQQTAFDTGELVGIAVGSDFGLATHDGSGFFFSCTGFVTLDLTARVAAGSFGSDTYQLQRN